MHKLYVDNENKATLVCPACDRSRTIDAASYVTLSRVVRMRIKCPCGQQTIAELERRRHFRKPVHFTGTYAKMAGRRIDAADPMAVVDLSRTGVRLRVRRQRRLQIGDRLMLQFQLDDVKRSTVCREGVVRRIDGADLGAEFTPTATVDANSKAIGFYLFAA